MASTSSAPITHEYDVFLSFRGEDTRNGFTDYLYRALNQAGITTFRDDNEIQEGQELKPEIEGAITESKASIIVLSKNYANSSWCLDELRLILEQKSNSGHIVFPVFYGVDPSDVRNQRGSFTIEAKEGDEASKWTQDNVKRWKAALREVANLKGMIVSGYEKDFIAKVVDKVYHQLGSEIHITPTDLTGIATRAEPIISWLRSDQPDHSVLAICGMGGGGKTTLAEYIYNSNTQNFDRCSLLKDINENQPDGLLGVQKKLLRDISGNSNMIISNVYEGAFKLKKAIQMNKVLIVVDDIDDKEKLTTLFGEPFSTKSKIIITTRIQNIDTWFGSISCGCRVHKIELLNDQESLELLSWHAFRSKSPIEGFEKLAVELAQYCEGSPLALKVLGSSLPVGAQDQWTRNNMIEIWRSRLDSLNSLKGDLDNKIECVLRKSFDSLPCDSHRELFLHIACLFIDEYIFDVEITLEKDWHAKSGVPTLINRCLVTKSTDGRKLAMHKLLQDMASKIGREESKHLAKRSRIRCKDEAYQFFKKGEGSEKIEGLSIQLGKVELGMTSEAFKTISLVKMKNLKLLQLKNVKLTGTYENFPDLRWLKWRGCNLKQIPPGLLTSYLVALYMRFGYLEEFDPPVVLNSLKILNLSYSRKLVSMCNLIRIPKLEQLDLNGCTSLTYICKTIGDLKSLSYLSLNRCTKLWKSNLIFISGKIPEQPLFFLPQSLIFMSIAHNSFEMFPTHINLKMLWKLDLNSCPNLKSLPCLPSMLQRLHVKWCSSLENITFQSGRYTLQVFEYEGCFKLCEIQGLLKLVSITEVDEADLQFMQWIKAYQNHFVYLVGDVITKDRTFNTQMLYEYGIRSTFLQGVTDQSMATHEYTSSSDTLSFHVPTHTMKHSIRGLNLTVMYSISSGDQDRNAKPSPLFIRINNRTKDITWVYSPVVYCKPRVDEDAIWLSYWPIGNTLDAGDEVDVDFLAEKGTIVTSGYGASVVYMDAGEAEKEEEKSETMKSEEVIGGDLSLFEVKGGFYLCRRDFYWSMILAVFFGEDIQITDSRRWRTHHLTDVYEMMNAFRNPNRIKIEVTLAVNFTSDDETSKIEKAVSSVEGVESVSAHKEIGRLIVCGCVDPSALVKCVREFTKMVQVLDYHPF